MAQFGAIMLVGYQVASRWVHKFVFEVYTDIGLTNIVGSQTSTAVWDGTKFTTQQDPIVFGGLTFGQTYYVRVGTITQFSGTTQWQQAQAIVAGQGNTPSGSTFSAVVTPTVAGVNFNVIVNSPPTDYASTDVVWYTDATVPSGSTAPMGNFPVVTAFSFVAGGSVGQVITGWARVVNTGGIGGSWQTLGSAAVAPLPSVPNTGGAIVKTGDYTAQTSDNGYLLVFHVSGGATLTLPPTPPTISGGHWNIGVSCVSISGATGALVTINPNGRNLDFSTSTLALSPFQGIYLTTDNSNTDYYSSRGISVSGGRPYDIVVSFSGQPADGTEYIVESFTRTVSFPSNFLGSGAHCLSNAAASGSFTLKRNGSSCGTISYTTGGAFTFTSSSGSPVTFSLSDYMTIITPTPQDSSLADIAITLSGLRGQ